MEILIGLTVGLVLFLCTVKSYILGLKHGKELSKGNIPKIDINPVKTFKEYIETKEKKKEENKIIEGWENIMEYDPYAKKRG